MMIDAVSQVNWLAVGAATVAQFVLGGVWFGAIFARQYVEALGIADKPKQMPSPLFLVGPLVCGAVTITTTAILLQALGIKGYGDALQVGLLVGIGYLAAMTVNIAINPLFPHPFRYALINAPMFIIGSLISCVILVALG